MATSNTKKAAQTSASAGVSVSKTTPGFKAAVAAKKGTAKKPAVKSSSAPAASNVQTPQSTLSDLVGAYGVGLDPDFRDAQLAQVAQLTGLSTTKVASVLKQSVQLGLVKG